MPIYVKHMAYEAARDAKAFLDRRGMPGQGLRQRAADKVKELNDSRNAAARRSAGPPALGQTPVFFVVGRPKSGTTWLMRTLNAHPEILCRGEGRFFGREWRRPGLREVRGNKQASSLYNSLLESEYLRLWIERSVWTRDDDPDEHLTNLTRLATEYFLAQKLAGSGKKIVGDKTPLLGPEIMEDVSRVYPEARVIHIIRDGRDAAVSMMHHVWNRSRDKGGPNKLEPEEITKRDAYRADPEGFLGDGESIFAEKRLRNAATIWRTRVSRAIKDGPALLGTHYAEVRYEDLLERPAKEAGRLFRFLGADASPRVVRRCVNATSFEKRSGGRKRGEEDSTSGVRKGVAGDWRNVFTEQDREIFKEEAGDLLVQLGYEKDHGW